MTGSGQPIRRRFMTLDQGIALFSATVSFIGLVFVGLQLRDATRQRTSDSLVEILDVNRELITLGFSHPQLFGILDDAKNADPIWEQYYLQLWLNQFSLIHSYLKESVLKGERRENLQRDLSDFMMMANMRRHWQKFGKFYPASFQEYVNEMLKTIEPPTAAQAKHPARNHEAKT
jgi:hypothetical protein